MAASLVALAVFFIHDSPPTQATHLDTRWAATMTVGSGATWVGYNGNAGIGSLTANTFILGGTDYTVETIRVESNQLYLTLDKTIPAGLGFWASGEQYSIAGGTLGRESGSDPANSRVNWATTLSWNAGNRVEVSLTRTPTYGVTLGGAGLDTTDGRNSMALTEGGTAKNFTVRLSSDPGTNNSVTVTMFKAAYHSWPADPPTRSSEETHGTYGAADHRWNRNAIGFTPAATDLTFTGGTSGNWNTAQNIQVSGVQDDDSCDEQLIILFILSEDDADNSVTGIHVAVDDDETGSCGGL